MDQATYCNGFHDNDAVSKMTYNVLGNTGMSVSALSLGKKNCASLHYRHLVHRFHHQCQIFNRRHHRHRVLCRYQHHHQLLIHSLNTLSC